MSSKDSQLRQAELDFTNKGYHRWAIDNCKRLKSLYVVEGSRRINLSSSEAKVLLNVIAGADGGSGGPIGHFRAERSAPHQGDGDGWIVGGFQATFGAWSIATE